MLEVLQNVSKLTYNPVLIAEADQAARSKLFEYAAASKVDLAKQMVEGQSNPDDPVQHSSKAVNLEGWEYLDFAEDEQDVDVGLGMCETLLHIACRVHNVELASFLIDKGTDTSNGVLSTKVAVLLLTN